MEVTKWFINAQVYFCIIAYFPLCFKRYIDRRLRCSFSFPSSPDVIKTHIKIVSPKQ